jgi:xanthine dehydrogenase small subunit
VGLRVTKEYQDLETVIHTGRARELATLRRARRRLEIGAAVTYTDMMAALAREYPAFGELIRRLGSVQIRNLGTIAGNLATASPIGDTLPALMALDATVVLRRGSAVREMPLDRFFLGYRRTALRRGEIIARLHIPRATAARRFAAYKVSKRFDQDIAAVCAAFSLRLDGDRVRDIRIAYGGMAATPKRAAACERALSGRAWTAETIEDAAQALETDFRPISDVRASGAYRMLVARNLVRKFWMETTGQGGDMSLALHGRPA